MDALAGVDVAYFGSYRADYARNRIVQAALRRAGARVVELQVDDGPPVWRWIRLARRARKVPFDVLFVGYPGFVSMPAAWIIGRARRVAIVFDAFLSLYETRVIDRREVPRLLAPSFRFVEWLACRLADVVLLDTRGQAVYLAERTEQDPSRFRWLWVGADETAMVPCDSSPAGDVLRVATYGNFAPIQGVPVILDAAELLRERGVPVRFVIAGDGPAFADACARIQRRGLDFVDLVGRLPYEALRRHLCDADVCLGVFAGSPKAQRIVPNKVFDALCLGRPVVTARSPAVLELLEDGVEVVLVDPDDAEALADALAGLFDDPDRRQTIGRAGRRRFVESASVDALARDLASWVPGLIR